MVMTQTIWEIAQTQQQPQQQQQQQKQQQQQQYQQQNGVTDLLDESDSFDGVADVVGDDSDYACTATSAYTIVNVPESDNDNDIDDVGADVRLRLGLMEFVIEPLIKFSLSDFHFSLM